MRYEVDVAANTIYYYDETILFPSNCCKTLKMLVFVRTRLFPSLLWLSAV